MYYRVLNTSAAFGFFIATACNGHALNEAELGHANVQPSQTNVQITRASAAIQSTSQLANRILPADANRIVAHEIAEPTFRGGPLSSITFFASPQPTANKLCAREVFYASFDPAGERDADSVGKDVPVRLKAVRKGIQIAAAPMCRMQPGEGFASVQPERAVVRALTALETLQMLQRRARQNSVFTVEVNCSSETREPACSGDVVKLFASLPLGKIYLIEPKENRWQFAVMMSRPGEHFWHLTLTPDRNNPRIDMKWRVPPPF